MKTISKLANELSIRTDTIRYYERIGLLEEPDRTRAGYRVYDTGAADRLRFIKGGQRLGLKLDEIRELLNIRDTGLCPCGHTATLLRKRITSLDEELLRLGALRQELAAMMDHWPQDIEQTTDGKTWHCAGELIPLPQDLSGWLCAQPEDCSNGHVKSPQTQQSGGKK